MNSKMQLINEINQQTGETEQIVDYHKMETAENKIDNEITDRMDTSKRKRTKVTERTN